MDVRMVQIPSDTGQHGAFEQLHGFASGQQFADTLCDRVARFHGTAFRARLAFLTHDQDASTTLARELLRRYQNALMPDNAGNRAAHRGPFCPAGGGRRDSDAARHHGLAERHGV